MANQYKIMSYIARAGLHKHAGMSAQDKDNLKSVAIGGSAGLILGAGLGLLAGGREHWNVGLGIGAGVGGMAGVLAGGMANYTNRSYETFGRLEARLNEQLDPERRGSLAHNASKGADAMEQLSRIMQNVSERPVQVRPF